MSKEKTHIYIIKDKTNGVENGKYKLANVNLSDDNILAGLLKGVGGLLGTLLGGLTVGTVNFVESMKMVFLTKI